MNHVPAPVATSVPHRRIRRTHRLGVLAVAIAAGVGLAAAPVVLSATPAAAAAGPATVTGVSPNSGVQAAGTVVTIAGTNLGATGTTTVSFGGTAATAVTVNASGTSLVATAPVNPNVGAGGTSYGSTFDITVNNGNGASATNKSDRYTYEYDTHTCGASPFSSSCAATLTGQETAPVTGSVVTASAGGANLIQVPVNATVTLDSGDLGTPTGANFSLSTLDVSTTPPNIIDNAHSSTTDTNTVTSAVPAQERFVAEADHCPTQPTFPSAPTVGCPLTPTGGNSDAIVVEWAAPTVTSISPSAGPLAGGTSVTITGTNLNGATAVNFGGVAGTGVVVNSATSVTAVAPAGAAGTVDVTVVTAARHHAVTCAATSSPMRGARRFRR